MGSPLSAVLANLFMETLEAGPFKDIIPNTITYLRYVDDILIISPRRFDLKSLQEKLNSVEPSIQFTLEEEKDDSLPFLDTLLIKQDGNLKFKVYRKPTNKNDLVHYFSHHDQNIKRGILIGFFLRALRICSKEFLEEEFQFIVNIFSELKYPFHLINDCKKKASKIILNPTKKADNIRHVLLPTGKTAASLPRILKNDHFRIACQTSETIKNLTRPHTEEKEQSCAGVYVIPCTKCDQVYIGETSRELDKRIREHKYACRIDDQNYACVVHRDKHNHHMSFNQSRIILREPDKTRRLCMEAALIQTNNTIEQNRGRFNLATTIPRLILPKSTVHMMQSLSNFTT